MLLFDEHHVIDGDRERQRDDREVHTADAQRGQCNEESEAGRDRGTEQDREREGELR